jgi:DNA polymerase
MQMEKLKEIGQKIRQCNVCKLEGHVVGTIIGDPEKVDLLCVGEAPREKELERGVPFCGPDGHTLRKLLSELGMENYAMINVLKCHPPGLRAPRAQEINSCLSFLKQQVEFPA